MPGHCLRLAARWSRIGNRVGLGKLAYVSKTAGTFWKSDWPYGIANKRPAIGIDCGLPVQDGM